MHSIRRPWLLTGILMALLVTPAFAQENAPKSDPQADESAKTTETTAASDETPQLKTWNRLIYVPFHQLQKVFNNDNATAVVPYAEYMELLKHYWKQNAPNDSPDAVITKAVYTASIEKEVARISVELNITVLRKDGWARLPLSFGKSAVGKMTSDDEENTILKGADAGTYELLLQKAGKRTVTLELLAAVTTSPEARSFELNCPTGGINELQITIPEGDQTVRINPVEVLLPIDGSNEWQHSVPHNNLPSVGSPKPVPDLRWTCCRVFPTRPSLSLNRNSSKRLTSSPGKS